MTMKAAFYLSLFFSLLASCNTPSSKKNNNAVKPKTEMTGSNDYIILKRFRIEDKQGFDKPLEVSSFLLPANWQVNSNVQWNAGNKCLPDMLQVSVNATSPDGAYELALYPATQFDWSDDPVYLDAMQRGFNLHSCQIAKPADASQYIAETLAPHLKAQVKSAKVIEALQQQMDAGAATQTQLARQGGNNAYSHKGSAAEGMLQFEDGKEGLAFCTVMQTIVTMGGTQGQTTNSYYCYVSMRMVLKYKSGSEPEARKIMSTLFSSTRINPTWWNGVQNFFLAVSKNAQDQTWKHTQEIQAVQQQMGNNILRNWEQRNAATVSNNTSSTDTDAFGKYLRGVEHYTDESGNKIELTSGYTNAWSRGDGSYLLSNNPAFDPNVAFNEDWKRLNK